MHDVLVNCFGGLSLPRKSVVRLTDRPDMTLDVYHGRKTTTQEQQQIKVTKFTSRGSSSANFIFFSFFDWGHLFKKKIVPVGAYPFF